MHIRVYHHFIMHMYTINFLCLLYLFVCLGNEVVQISAEQCGVVKKICNYFKHSNSEVVRIYICISSGYDITGWQMQLVTLILTKVKEIFTQIAHQKNKEIRKN